MAAPTHRRCSRTRSPSTTRRSWSTRTSRPTSPPTSATRGRRCGRRSRLRSERGGRRAAPARDSRVTTAAGRLPPGAGRSIDPRRRTFWLLSLPATIALGLFLILPILFMIALSFRADLSGQLLAFFEPTLKQYAKVFATGSYWNLLGVSTLMAFAVAIV